ncbi:immunoglobulin superfamily member 1-like [Huso huso]
MKEGNVRSPNVISSISVDTPKPALTREPAGEISEGDTVTLSCVVEGGSGGWRYLWYKDRQGAPVYQPDSSSGTGAGYTISAAVLSHSGEYWCGAGRGRNTFYSQYSEGVKIQVSELFSTPILTVLPGASVWEGEAVTLQCGAHINKQGTQLQYRYSKDNGTVRGAGSQDQHSIPAAGLRDTGRYQCEVEAAGTRLKKRSASVSLTVRALFSRVTLTASPGATVKEGEALNLTCEAAVNKTPHPELHYTIVRDGEPVTNSTDSALYNIASTEKSHTGSYTCAVESQGVKKSSQELHIEVQTSWHSAVAIGYRVSFSLILFIVFTLLLLQYCRIQGSPCLAGGKSRKTSDQDQEQSAEGIELSSRVQHTGVEWNWNSAALPETGVELE